MQRWALHQNPKEGLRRVRAVVLGAGGQPAWLAAVERRQPDRRARLVFVEVKTRGSEEFGSPDRAVGPDKREHLERVARYYARQAGIEWGRARFDIVNVLLTATPRIELLRDAFRSGRTL